MRVIESDRIGRTARLTPGTAAVIFDPSRLRILLTRRSDNGRWCLPGGRIEPGESAAEGCVREVLEETGLHVQITQLIGIYTSPHIVIEYPDGGRRQPIGMCFEAAITGGALGLSNETTEAGFFSLEQSRTMDIVEHHVQRITDAFENTPQPFLR